MEGEGKLEEEVKPAMEGEEEGEDKLVLEEEVEEA